MAGERCSASSNSYCARHMASRRRAVFAGRRTNSVLRKRKMRGAASSWMNTSATDALMRSGKRKVGETLVSL